MAIKAIRKYVTESGHEFDTMEEATLHNAAEKARTAVRSAFIKANPTAHLGTLITDLCNNPAALTEARDSMNKMLDYHRRYGKLVQTNKASMKKN